MVFVALIISIYILYFVVFNSKKLSYKNKRKTFLVTVFLLIFLIASLRDSTVGTDTVSYMNKFLLIQDYSFKDIFSNFYCERLEIGYVLLAKLVGSVWCNPRAMIIVSAAIIYSGMGRFVYRYLDDDLTSVVLFVCSGMLFYSFNITRQIIAGVILLNSWGYLKEKKYLKSILCFIVSVTFHVTSICFLVAFLVYFLRNNKKLSVCVLVCGALVSIFYKEIINLLSKIITIHYFDNQRDKASVGGIILVWIVEIFIILIFLFYYYFEKNIQSNLFKTKKSLSPIDSYVIPVYVAIYIITTFIGSKFNYFDRFGIYFLPFCIPMFENFGILIKDKSPMLYKVYLVGLQCCFIALFMIDVFSPNHIYSFFW